MGHETFLARQPIVDAQHRLFAYELLFRRSLASVSAQITSQLQAGVEVTVVDQNPASEAKGNLVRGDAMNAAALREAGIGVEWMDTGAACRTFNVLLLDDRDVAAALVAVD